MIEFHRRSVFVSLVDGFLFYLIAWAMPFSLRDVTRPSSSIVSIVCPFSSTRVVTTRFPLMIFDDFVVFFETGAELPFPNETLNEEIVPRLDPEKWLENGSRSKRDIRIGEKKSSNRAICCRCAFDRDDCACAREAERRWISPNGLKPKPKSSSIPKCDINCSKMSNGL